MRLTERWELVASVEDEIVILRLDFLINLEQMNVL
jgi:hypothetical protein